MKLGLQLGYWGAQRPENHVADLGEIAASRGVSRRYLCSSKRDPCSFLPKCPAQPRIETDKTPTCVHAAIPTVGFGAVVKDGQILYGDDVGEE